MEYPIRDSDASATPTQSATDAVPADRRDALCKIGRFAAYAAPLTVLLLPQKTRAAS